MSSIITSKMYDRIVEEAFPKVLDENILFWHMWNIAYIYEILEQKHEGYEEHFELLQPMWEFCWEVIRSKNINRGEFEKIFGEVYPFDINEEGAIINPKNIIQATVEELSDDNFTEYCISSLVGAFGTVYDFLRTGERTLYDARAGSRTIGMIFQIIASNGLGTTYDEQTQSLVILQDEFHAQQKMLYDLSGTCNYTITEKNLYRNRASMKSLEYVDEKC